MKAISRRSYLRAGAVGVGGLLAGCTQSDDGDGQGDGTTTEPTGSEDSLKIGMPITLTGSFGAMGHNQREGVRVKQRQLNENGGLLGRNVEIVTEPSSLDPSEGVRAARNLVNGEDVDLLMGAISSAKALAIGPVAKELDVPFLIPSSTTTAANGGQCNTHMFRTCGSTNWDSVITARAIDEFGHDRIHVVSLDYEWGQALVDGLRTALSSLGRDPDETIVQTDWVGLDRLDFSTEITNAQGSDSSAVISYVTGDHVLQYLSQALQFGLLQEKFHTGTYLTAQNNLRELGTAVLDAELTGSSYYTWLNERDGNKQFVSDFIDSQGQPPWFIAAQGHVAIDAYAKAVEEAGSAATDDVISTFEGFEWESQIMGQLRCRECDHQTVTPAWLTEPMSTGDYDGTMNDLIGHETSATVPSIVEEYSGDDLIRDCADTGCQL